MTKRRITLFVLGLFLLIGGLFWAFRGRADAQVERVKQLQDQMFAGGPQKPEDRQRLHEEMQKLNPEQHHAVRAHMHEHVQRRRDQQIDEYFELSPEKREEFLDQQIEQQERRRKEWEARRQQNRQNERPSGPGQSGPAQANRPPRNRRNRTPEAHSARRNTRLDRSSPEKRAKRSAYFADLQKRRVALGLPAWPWHGHHHRH